MEVISKLSDQQKEIVREIDFSSILELCCSAIPKNLFMWLVENYDTGSNTVNLPNGFSFSLNSSVVRSILGTPKTSRQIQCRRTENSYQFIKSQFKSVGQTPSIYELAAMITPDLSGEHFARAFMLLVLSSFLCSNKRNLSSSKYFSAIVSVPDIKKFDWCSLVLQWLNSSISKFQNQKRFGQSIPNGGCALLLVVTNTFLLQSSFLSKIIFFIVPHDISGSNISFSFFFRLHILNIYTRIQFWK